MEPAQVTNNYRQYLLIGYVSKLLVIHSQTTLYIFCLCYYIGYHIKIRIYDIWDSYSPMIFSFPDNSTTNIEELNGLKLIILQEYSGPYTELIIGSHFE